MLRTLCLKHLSLAAHLHAEFAERLNVITGDNGLGKSFLLDVAWWALTASWATRPVVPQPRDATPPALHFVADEAHDPTYHLRPRVLRKGGRYDGLRQTWVHDTDGWVPAVVLYVQVDGSFALWDAARHVRLEGPEHAPEVVRAEGQRFGPETLWSGLKDGDRVVCRGLIDDWVTWQLQRDHDPHRRFEMLSAVLERLTPHPGEWMRPGPPQRVFVDDARDFPTVETPYGTVPVVHASAAMKRILGLAYLLVWAWNEHREASRLRGMPTAQRLVLLCDEVETHLHPQWQRRIMPALLTVAELLDPKLAVQFLVTTHAPLVLASLEPVFDPARDRLFLLELDAAREVVLEQVPWARRGDASSWLTSPHFGLEQARSLEAEEAIEAAERFMRGEGEHNPAGLRTADAIDQRLRGLLGGADRFWPRWLVKTGQV